MYTSRYTCPMCSRSWYYVDGEASLIGGEGPDEGEYCGECGFGWDEYIRPSVYTDNARFQPPYSAVISNEDEEEEEYGELVPLFPVKEFCHDYLPFTVQYCEQPAWLEEAGKRGPIPPGVFTAVVRAFWADMVDITGRI